MNYEIGTKFYQHVNIAKEQNNTFNYHHSNSHIQCENTHQLNDNN